MELRTLGKTKLETAPMVLGGNVFGWTLNETDSIRILDEAFDLGFRTIDTANVYSRWKEGNVGGESETIIGKWLKKWGDRDKVIIITKVGGDVGQGHIDLTEKHILKAADDSLKRLQTSYIDLYFTHFDDEKTPIEETLGAYQKLIDAGKVRYIGASNLSAARLKDSLSISRRDGLPRYEVLEPEYNMYDRRVFEETTGPICSEERLGVISYYALASGFLTGKYRSEADISKSARGAKAAGYLNERGKKILAALDNVAETHNVPQAAIALAWLLHKPAVTAPIASATKSSHLHAFVEAIGIRLTDAEMKQLDSASAY